MRVFRGVPAGGEQSRDSGPARRWLHVVLLVVALVLCSGTTASAAFLITGKQIKDGSVTGRDVRDHSLQTTDLKGVVRGPTGPIGPAGPVGPVGPTGPTGPAAVSAPVFKTASGTIAGSSSGGVSVSCPSGTVAAGGGGVAPLESGVLEQSAPSDVLGTGWTVSFFDLLPTPITVTAAVVCVTAH
jgi:hypothetical protein